MKWWLVFCLLPCIFAQEEWIIRGFDVSHLDGEVDWGKVVAGGYAFVFVKATEGDDFVDPQLHTNLDGARKSGIPVGAYHFYRTNDDPEVQARNFIENTPLKEGDLAPVVDIEVVTPGSSPGWLDDLRRFLQTLEQHYRVVPIIYTSPHFWNSYGNDTFGKHPLWIAEYGVDQPAIPAGFDHWTWWQFSDDHSIAGIPSPVDVSYFRGHHSELNIHLIPATEH